MGMVVVVKTAVRAEAGAGMLIVVVAEVLAVVVVVIMMEYIQYSSDYPT